MSKLNHIKSLSICLVCFAMTFIARAQQTPKAVVNFRSLDSAEAIYIAKQILDSSVVMGTFVVPHVQSRLRTLRNGIMPELEKDYLEIAMNFHLTKLNTIHTLRGDFDSMIYLQTPTINTDAEEPLEFYPYPGTRWLLLLNSAMDIEGKGRAPWADDLARQKSTRKYLTAKTLFSVTSEYHGNEILKWNDEYETGYNAYLITDKFVNELSRMLPMVEQIKQDKDKADRSQVLLSSTKWEDEASRKLAAILDGMLYQKPQKIEEPSTEGQ